MGPVEGAQSKRRCSSLTTAADDVRSTNGRWRSSSTVEVPLQLASARGSRGVGPNLIRTDVQTPEAIQERAPCETQLKGGLGLVSAVAP